MIKSTAVVAKRSNTSIVGNMTPEQVELIKNTIAKGATDDELKLFLYTANKSGLDPLTRQIHFVKRESNKKNPQTGQWEKVGVMTIQTGIDGYRAIAARTGELAGEDDAVFDTEEAVNPRKASVTVYRLVKGNRVAFTASARWSEYVQQYEKKNYQTGQAEVIIGNMWKKMPYLMLAKCASALAYRKAFPNDLSGIYTDTEMQQADEPIKTDFSEKQVQTPATEANPPADPQNGGQATDYEEPTIDVEGDMPEDFAAKEEPKPMPVKFTGATTGDPKMRKMSATLLINAACKREFGIVPENETDFKNSVNTLTGLEWNPENVELIISALTNKYNPSQAKKVEKKMTKTISLREAKSL